MVVSWLERSLRLLLVFPITCLLLLFFCSGTILAQNGGNITLRLFEAYRIKSIEILPPFELLAEGGSSKITIPCTVSAENGRIWLRPSVKRDYKTPGNNQPRALAILSEMSFREADHKGLGISSDSADLAHGNRKYHGIVTICFLKRGAIDIINKVSCRDYVTGVVESESPKDAPYEMLRAQAVLAQTILVRQKGTYLIGDSTQSQCYLGCSLECPLTKQAVDSVWGKNLYYKDLPINVYYHSTCAGGTINGAKFFHLKNKNLAYLTEIHCKNCSQSPFWKPTIKEIPMTSFAKVFGNGLPEILNCDYTGRPLSIKLSNRTTMTGYDFWISLGQHFGWDKAPGTRFKLKAAKNGNIIIESTGAGHGVGLCQWGASALAKQGKSYKEILGYYFPGCVIH